MADIIDYKIYGDDMQIVEVELDPGEEVRAEAGAMTYMSDGIEIQTSTGGVFQGVKRMLTGESFFITTFLYNGGTKGRVGFGAPYPGKIIPIDLSKVKWMNSSGLGALMAGLTTLRNAGGDLKLANVTKKIESLLLITKLITVFETYESVDRAVASFLK